MHIYIMLDVFLTHYLLINEKDMRYYPSRIVIKIHKYLLKAKKSTITHI